MTDRIWVLPTVGGVLELPDTVHSAYFKPAPTMAPSHDAEPLLDAEQLAAALNLPKSWIETAARQGKIPVVKAGRWIRFRRAAVIAALEAGND